MPSLFPFHRSQGFHVSHFPSTANRRPHERNERDRSHRHSYLNSRTLYPHPAEHNHKDHIVVADQSLPSNRAADESTDSMSARCSSIWNSHHCMQRPTYRNQKDRALHNSCLSACPSL